MNEQTSRNKSIIRTSVLGIAANVFLAGFKAVVGLTANSIAIVMDAVNNLSDAASSVITIIGTKLAGKEPDKKHPFGYGRIEYLSAMVISLLVLYAGVTAFVESVKKIIRPDTPEYGHSDSLINSGADATMDAVISAATLVAAAIYLLFHVSLEAWLGAIIAAVIIKSGLGMLAETLSKILGERADAQLARDIKKTITGHPEINGAYDLVLHNYGPDSYNGSVHIEVPDTLSADDLDKLIRKVTVEVYQKHDVLLTAVGVYSVNTKDPEAAAARQTVSEIVTGNPDVLQMHGFYLDQAEKTLRFDIVVSFDAADRKQVYREVCEKVQQAFPDYTLQVAMDTDFSEESDA